MKKVICSECGGQVEETKFCNNCGALLKKVLKEPKEDVLKQKFGHPGFNLSKMINGNKTDNVSKEPNDQGLTLLVNYCKKTVATVGGDGYDEVVLYHDEKADDYQIHTYMKYEYMEKEIHKGYKASRMLNDDIFEIIKNSRLSDCEGKREGIPLCGAEHILKFRNEEGRLIRLTDDNIPESKKTDVSSIVRLLYSVIGEENEL